MDYKIIDTLYIGEINQFTDLKNYIFTNLQKNRKDSFEPDERIVVNFGNSDWYNPDEPVGLKLKILLRIVNKVDISPCFILVQTTNPNIEQEINQIDSINSDKNNIFDFDIMEGEYVKSKSNSNKTDEYIYGSLVPDKIQLSELTDREKYLLMESKTFCMYPWVHLNASPNGQAQPCCLWHHGVDFGSVKTKTLEQVWNSDKMKKLRYNMLNDIQSPGCKKCYEEERAGFFSPRQSANKHQGHHVKRVAETSDTGQLDRFQMTYWDIRFSNLCNLSCRSCGHIFSSSWYQDQVKLAGPEWGKKNKALFWAGKHETDMYEQLMEHIDYVEQIYFAGGEPLMMDEHYKILEELEKRKRFDVRLVYNTNFTKTKLKDRYVFEYWRKFESVSVGASLDAMGPRAEYIRKGTNWAEVEKNRQMMMEQCPNVDFYISPTMSILNVLHLPDFHRNWVERGLIKPQDLNINLLVDPTWLQISIANESYKEKIREKYEKHLEWLAPQDKFGRARQGFESTLNVLKDEQNIKANKIFWQRMTELDRIRNENVLEAIPELDEIRINN